MNRYYIRYTHRLITVDPPPSFYQVPVSQPGNILYVPPAIPYRPKLPLSHPYPSRYTSPQTKDNKHQLIHSNHETKGNDIKY